MRYLHQIAIPNTRHYGNLFKDRYQSHRTVSRWLRGERAPVFLLKEGETIQGAPSRTVFAYSDLEMPNFTESEYAEVLCRTSEVGSIQFRKGQHLHVSALLNAVTKDDWAVWNRALYNKQNPRDALRDWCCDKFRKAGFKALDVDVHSYQFESFAKAPNEPPIRVYPVQVEMTCSVEDPEKAIQHLLYGVAQGKAFGFGMVLARRA